MRILISDKLSQGGVELLERDPDFQVDVKLNQSPQDLLAAIPEYDALIIRSATKVTAEVIERAARLRVIGRAGSGVDNVDVEAATRRSIVVMNTPGGNSISVAEHTLALMLSLARHIPQANQSVKQGKWEKKAFLGLELRDKTLGILGLGKVAVEVARRAAAFKMKILVFDPFVSERRALDLGAVLVSLDDLLRQSDFITLHLALTPETQGFMNAAKLGLMKPTAYLINCARGEVVDEAALYDALSQKKIAGAALDVFYKEPPSDRRLLELPNLIATPHLGASTVEAQETVGLEIAAQVRDFLKTGIPQNAVNLPSLTLEEFQKLDPYLRLGERLGTFLATIASGRLNEIGIRYYGDLNQMNAHVITNSIVKSILAPISDRVNAVNARALATERGICIIESHSSRPRPFANLISLKLHLDPPTSATSPPTRREEWIEGTVLPGSWSSANESAFRIVSIDGIDVEAPLRGTILFFRNEDTPGVIGHVGATLGRAQINIAGFALGRDEQAHSAIGVMNVDDGVPDAVLEEIQSLPAIWLVKKIRMS